MPTNPNRSDGQHRTHRIDGRHVAILATDGVEQEELTRPFEALRDAGAEVDVIAPPDTMARGRIRGWNHTDWGDDIEVDKTLDQADADEYDALVLPGGVMNPDKLRIREDATSFVRQFFKAGKPVAAICHGPWLLIDSGVVDGRRMTSYPSLKLDLKNAGARWEDNEVVVDQGLVTSRSPKDLPAFIEKMTEEIAEGAHAAQKTA